MKYNRKERLSDSAFSLYERLLLSGLSLSLSYAFLLQCLSRLCRCSACCSNPQTWSLPRSDTFTYFQRELPHLTSCDRLQVKQASTEHQWVSCADWVPSAGYCSVCSEIWATLEYFLLKLHVPLYCGSFCLFLPLISSLSSSSYTQLLAAFLRHCFHHCPPTSTVVNLSV